MVTARYKPVGRKATGGMGEVAEYEDQHLQRKVIIKRLQAGQEQRRIVDEQKALLKLRSKHVIQLFDIIEFADRGAPEPALVLEYISGNDLSIGSYSPDVEYLKVIWQVACGLRDIHAAGVIHRDIKPANIRLDDEGIVKILDFGLARSDYDAHTKGAVGTPVFMAPELWGTKTVSFNSSIDVYAFGVTCLALLSASVPPELAQYPPAPIDASLLTTIIGGLPAEVSAVIADCLNHSPKKRPSMETVEKAFARQLLKDRHRALMVIGGKTYYLNADSRQIKVNGGASVGMQIHYDGFDFVVTAVTGKVTFNNKTVKVGDVVPGCCVITFYDNQNRVFVTFDVSTPEFMA